MDVLHQALKELDSRCDGAITEDTVGFNKPDSHIGKTLAALPELTPPQRHLAWEMLQKYRVQLEGYGIDLGAVEPPQAASESIDSVHGDLENQQFVIQFKYDPDTVQAVKRIPNAQFEKLTKVWTVPLRSLPQLKAFLSEREGQFYVAPSVEELAKRTPLDADKDRHITLYDEILSIQFPKDPDLIEAVKQLPYRQFDWEDMAWKVPLAHIHEVIAFGEEHRFLIPESVLQAAESIRPYNPRQIAIEKGLIAITFPYDPGLVAEVKKLPGSKFDRRKVRWTAPVMSIVSALEFARGNDFEIPVEMEALGEEAEIRTRQSVELSRADDAELQVEGLGGELMSFQKAGVAYALRTRRCFISDEMGCVEGSAILNVNRAGRGFKVSLRDAYRRFNGVDARYVWDTSIPTYCRALCDGELRQHHVKAILYNGAQTVVELRLASHKTLRLTPDHEVALPDGAWTTAESLEPGDEVVVNGKFVDRDGYVRVCGRQGHPRANPGGQVYEHILRMEAKLGRTVGRDELVHHIDGNGANNAISNLKLVTPSQHHRLHKRHRNMNGGVAGRGGHIQFVPDVDSVVSVTPAGEMDVYDVVMEDPYRNFVANGIVVHNCGKTVESFATLQAAGAFPALVVCPASLKLNWEREARKWLPDRTSMVVSGTTPLSCYEGDIVIINYDILSAHCERLRGVGFAALVADESHFVKESRAQRSQALKQVSENIEYRLLLTGTPMPNRPVELAHQLDVLGRLEDFGGFWAYCQRYCAPYHNGWGWNFDGASNMQELNERLRACCYIRRRKKDVLAELPDKREVVIPVEIDNRSQYSRAEADTIRWIAAQAASDQAFLDSIRHLDETEQSRLKRERANDAAMRAARAETLVRIEALKQICAHGKLAHVSEWIASFLESGEKLVVFAHHVDVQGRLLEIFPHAARILSEDSVETRQENVDRFQSDAECRLIVCSLQAGGVGITLTAASNVLFTELGWNPATHSQALDRCHRIGQKNAVTGWYMVGERTVEDDILDLIRRKEQVVTEVVDGADADESQRVDVMNQLVAKLQERGVQNRKEPPEPTLT